MRTMELKIGGKVKSKRAGEWPCAKVKEILPQGNIGRMARMWHHERAMEVVGNVLDLVAGSDEPKRVRVQFGCPALKGEVLQPAQYDFLGWADEEED